MRQNEFKIRLIYLSNHKLYMLAKKLLTQEQLGFTHNNWECKYIQDECEKRNPKIFNDALNDSIIEVNSIEGSMDGLKVINISRIDHYNNAELVHFLHSVGAATSNPILDTIFKNEKIFNLSENNKENFFLCQVSGESMIEAEINSGDTLVVERNIEALDDNIIIASIDSDLIVKRLKHKNGTTYLYSENKIYPPIEITDEMNFSVYGIVRLVIHKPK